MDWSLIVTIAVYLLGIGVIYGTLKTQIRNLEKQQDCTEKRMDGIEERHNAAIDGIRQDVKAIGNTLNQLVGKIDMFFQLYKDGKNE